MSVRGRLRSALRRAREGSGIASRDVGEWCAYSAVTLHLAQFDAQIDRRGGDRENRLRSYRRNRGVKVGHPVEHRLSK